MNAPHSALKPDPTHRQPFNDFVDSSAPSTAYGNFQGGARETAARKGPELIEDRVCAPARRDQCSVFRRDGTFRQFFSPEKFLTMGRRAVRTYDSLKRALPKLQCSSSHPSPGRAAPMAELER